MVALQQLKQFKQINQQGSCLKPGNQSRSSKVLHPNSNMWARITTELFRRYLFMMHHVLNASLSMHILSIFKTLTTFNGNHSFCVCSEICMQAAQHVPKRRYVKKKKDIVFVLLSAQESIDLGEIMYSLCYLPTAGRMTLTVIKCRNLKAMDITGSSGNQPAAEDEAYIKHGLGHSSILSTKRRQVADLNEDGHTGRSMKNNYKKIMLFITENHWLWTIAT